jgi:hypothetical protein
MAQSKAQSQTWICTLHFFQPPLASSQTDLLY